MVKYITVCIMFFFTACGGGDSSLSKEPESAQSHTTNTLPQTASSAVVVQKEKIGSYTLLYPKNISKKLPVILFVPGWGSQNPDDYKTLVEFIVSQGNILFFAPEYADEYGCNHLIEEFETIYRESKLRNYCDISRLGVVGHSSGGGKAYRIFHYFYQKGWGGNGSFIFSMAPWFAFDMGEIQMQNLPQNGYYMTLLFSEDMSTDIRIPMTIYSMLSQVPKAYKTFYIYRGKDAVHQYPYGDAPLSSYQAVTEPLRALLMASFYHNSEKFSYYDAHGSDQPWDDYKADIRPSYAYSYDCFADQGAEEDPIYTALFRYGVDYCAVVP